MDWKKKLYVLGVVLLCTSVLAAVASANNPNQHVKKAAISAVPQDGVGAQLKDATGSYDPIVITRTAVIPPEVRPPVVVQNAREKVETELGKTLPADGNRQPATIISNSEVHNVSPGPQDNQVSQDGRAYCTASSPCDEYIKTVVLGTINNTSACTSGGYADYTTISTDMQLNATYSFTVTNGTPYSSDQCAIWIDWNQSQVWDAAEKITPTNPTGVGPYVGTITVPATATLGATRMRVRICYTGTITPCGAMSYGETEDYTINVIPPPPQGACCTGYTCVPDQSAAACATLGGVYYGDGSTCTPNPCQAACCYNYPATICADNSQAECTALGGQWHLGQACGTYACPPWNDACTAVTPVLLAPATPVVFTGTNIGSTNDCTSFPGGNVWVAFTIPVGEVDAVNDLKLEYCGSVNTATGGPFGNCWLNLATACPCTTFSAAGTWEATSCADANTTVRWAGLAAGTYYYPVLLDDVNNAAGDYVITVSYLPGYCASNATSTADENIQAFTLGTINHTNPTTGWCDTYNNFTAESTLAARGTNNAFSLTIGDCEGASCYGKRASIFVDWNHDFDFVDAGEIAWTSGQIANAPCPVVTVTGSIYVPITAALGPARLRIVVVETSSADPLPCGTYSWGATEDYTIDIQPAPPTGACCFGMTCQDSGSYTQETCELAGGRYAGDGSSCSPNLCFGACCKIDGTCSDQIDEAACLTEGGIFHGAGTACATLVCPQPGDECSNPAVVATLPFTSTFNNSTAAAGPPSCNTYYTLTQNDWWFKYVATTDVCLNYAVTDLVGAGYDMVMGVYTGPDCANLTNIICLDDPEPYAGTINAVAGTTYWFQIGKYGSSAGGGLTQIDLFACPFGACCVSGVCSQMYLSACTAAGGVFKGDGVACTEDICLTAACCFQPANNCVELTEVDCTGQGGTWFSSQSCATFNCPTPGDNCLSPLVVSLPAQLPYTDPAQHTCGRVDDYNATCLGYYDGGEDMIYQLVVTEAICVNITVTGVDASQNWIGVGLDSVCPLGATCMKVASSSGNVVTMSNVALPPGTFYIMVDTWPTPNCLTNYTTTIVASTGCPSGACCLAGTGTLGCSVMFKDACLAAGGSFGGNGSVCSGLDCNADGTDDMCDILGGAPDCNANGIPDVCDLDSGFSHDWDNNGIPDDCQADCNANGYPDFCDLPGGCAIGGCSADPACGQSLDCQPDGIPDECQLGGGGGGGGGGMVFDAGVCDGVNGGRPTAGWDVDGVVVPFAVPQGSNGLTFNKVHVDLLDFAQTDMPAMQVRMYALPTGSIVADLPSFAAAVAIFDHTYTVASGELVITTRAECYVGAGAWNYDATGPSFTFTPGAYAMFVNFPGSGAVNYWASAADYGYGGGFVWGVDIDIPGPWDPAMAFAFNLSGGGGGGGGDCNANGIPDDCDIASGTSLDCNFNGIPDECEVAMLDCNTNGIPDDCDIGSGFSQDCNANGIPDECDIAAGTSQDCNGNSTPDECDIASGLSQDCNNNGQPDECDVSGGNSADCNHNGIPDECELGTQAGGQILLDPGFEAGIATPYWAATSTNFGTPLCDAATCGSGGGTSGAHTGLVWAWFGGAGATGLLPEVGTLSQAVVIPSGPAATLSFYFWIGASGGAGADTFTATVDGNTVFAVVDGDPLYTGGYTLVTIPLAASYSDGLSHTIEFTGIQTTGTSTNFNLDDVALDVPGGAATNDCNNNGIPDICDIQVAFGGFCEGTTYPPCDTDYNHNGVPDHCEICGDFTGSMVPPHVPDGLVNVNDYWYIHDGIGVCVGDPKYTEHSLADLDGDGCITLADYQSWLMCYHMQNGKVFVPPTRRIGQATPTQVPTSIPPKTGGGAVTPTAPKPTLR
jgi:hypothetical protein